MKKKVLCTVLVLTMLLTACSTPAETPSTTSSTTETETQKPATTTTNKNDSPEVQTGSELVEIHFSPLFAIFLNAAISEESMNQFKESYNFEELKENPDGSLTGTISKKDIEEKVKKNKDTFVDELTADIQNGEAGSIQSFTTSDDLMNLEFIVDSNSYSHKDITNYLFDFPQINAALLSLDGCSVTVKDTENNILESYNYPNENDLGVGGKLGNSYIAISGIPFLDKNYEGKDCITFIIRFQHINEEPLSFELAMMPKAFQNGVQLDTAYIDSEESKTASKEIQPGYTVVVAKSFLLSDLEHPVDFQVEEFLSMENTGKIKKTYDIAAYAQ